MGWNGEHWIQQPQGVQSTLTLVSAGWHVAGARRKLPKRHRRVLGRARGTYAQVHVRGISVAPARTVFVGKEHLLSSGIECYKLFGDEWHASGVDGLLLLMKLF